MQLIATTTPVPLRELTGEEQWNLKSAAYEKLGKCFDGGDGFYGYHENAEGEGELAQFRCDMENNEQRIRALQQATAFAGMGGVLGGFTKEEGSQWYTLVGEREFTEAGIPPVYYRDEEEEDRAESLLLGLCEDAGKNLRWTGHAWVCFIGNMERAYGGPEEGGWWYDSGERLAILRVDTLEDIAKARDLLGEMYAEEQAPRGGFVGITYGGPMPPQCYPENTPRYE